MDSIKDTANPSHPATPDEYSHACVKGVVYISHLVEGEDGDEVEVYEVVACKRCQR